MKQDAKTSTPHEVSTLNFPLNQITSSIPSKVSPEVEILEEGFSGGQHEQKTQSQWVVLVGKRPNTRSMSQKGRGSLKCEQSLDQSLAIPTKEHAATTGNKEPSLPHHEKDIPV